MATSRGNFSSSGLPDDVDKQVFDGELAPLATIQLDGVKARQFLHSLARRPFVTLVLEGDKLKVYCKGMSEDHAKELMAEFLEQEDEA